MAKSKMPINKVLSGVKELSIALIELEISVCATENKKTGIKVPNMEVISKYFHCLCEIFVKLLKPMTKIKLPAKMIRNAPN